VFPGQGKTGTGVVESRFFKAFDYVASLAFIAELSLVGILAVAVGAIGKGDLPAFFPIWMALHAGQGAVFSPQREPGLIMVELGGFPGSLFMAGAAVVAE
jgi:hypothetical protein